MMQRVDVRAVFFDAGETLVHPRPSFPGLFAEVLQREGYDVDSAHIQATVSIYSERFADASRTGKAPRLWSTSPERSREFWLEVYRHFLVDLGVQASGEDREALAVALYSTFADPGNYELHPDAGPTLRRLHGAAVTMGVVSNFEAWLEEVLEAVGVVGYFPVRVISGIEGVEKPDPRIFELALQRAGVPADGSVYVGDHPFFDVEASRRAGLFPVLIDRRDRYPDADCVRVTTLEDLPAAIGLDV